MTATAVLKITDGTTSIDMLNPNGIHLEEWKQNVLGLKDSGVWQDSPMADGRRMAMSHYANIIDEFVIKAKGGSQNTAIRWMQELMRLLQKGTDYWTSTWQGDPVYIQARASKETNTRYAIVKSFRVEELNNPYASPFLLGSCSALFDGISVFVEHGPWQDAAGGTGTRIELCTEREMDSMGWMVSTSAPTVVRYGFLETTTGRLIVADTADMNYTDDGSSWSVATSAPASMDNITGMCQFGSKLFASGLVTFTGAPEVWESSDNGANWSVCAGTAGNHGSSAQVRNALIDGEDGYMYMVDMDGTYAYALGACLYQVISRSTDGAAWTVVSTPDISSTTQNCTALVHYKNASFFGVPNYTIGLPGMPSDTRPSKDPWDPDVLYMSAFVVCAHPLPWGAGCTGDGNTIFYASFDGDTWYTLRELEETFGLYSRDGFADSKGAIFPATAGTPKVLYEWSEDNGGDGYLYLGTTTATSTGYIYRSRDGLIWQQIQLFSSGVNSICAHGGRLFVGLGNGKIYVGDGTSFVENGDLGTAIGGLISYGENGLLYASETGGDDVYVLGKANIGQECTLEDGVIVANKCNTGQITHAYNYEASGPTYTSIYPLTTFPTQILPVTMDNGDIAYFGNDTSALGVGTGPFSNLVFDIGTPASGDYTLTWQYYNGAWVGLSVVDETNSLSIVGVGVVNWIPPDDWTAVAINGVTGYWMRAIISAVGGAPVGPTQDNRNIYSVLWAGVHLGEDQVLGDIPALMRAVVANRSSDGTLYTDAYAPILEDLYTLQNRVIVGVRSEDRGTFQPYINLSDVQNPAGIAVSLDATAATFADAIEFSPTGRRVLISTVKSALPVWSNALTVEFGPDVSRNYYGEFRAFLRGGVSYTNPSLDQDQMMFRLKVKSGSGGIEYVTDTAMFTCKDAVDMEHYAAHQLLDFGRISLPVSGAFRQSEMSDESSITVQFALTQVGVIYVYLHDLILIPVDEWSGDFIDTTLIDGSGVYEDSALDVDSVRYPKRQIRALVRDGGVDGFIRSAYQSITPGPAMLQANADQSVYFLTARGMLMGKHTGGNNATDLTSANTNFLRAGVKPGMTVYNYTDGCSGEVEDVAEHVLSLRTLSGGGGNDFDTGDVFWIICGNWRSEPWNLNSIQIEKVSRYTAMRGDR